jgi:hypothetical protein
LVILNNPLLAATLTGLSGAFHGHIVFQPIPVPSPSISDGCQENSRFTVEDFTGSLDLTGPAVAQLIGLDGADRLTLQTAANQLSGLSGVPRCRATGTLGTESARKVSLKRPL